MVSQTPAAQDYLAEEIQRLQSPVQMRGTGVIGTTINLIGSLILIIGLMYLMMLGIKFIYVKASI
ncbi:MAG TPA: hypothetical protein ENN55_06075, partial [Firmicutes bacterium]|nr:hypothetical protein [Bacillota bacterium]